MSKWALIHQNPRFYLIPLSLTKNEQQASKRAQATATEQNNQ
jgi:hypothetical protein